MAEGLRWVRIEAALATHDKTLALLADPSPKRWQAALSGVYAIGWSGQHATDGFIPKLALPFIHGTEATAALLVKHRMWEVVDGGWLIPNYAERQELAAVTVLKRERQRLGARKTNCRRYHDQPCECWQQSEPGD
jgi:hypothetical protein